MGVEVFVHISVGCVFGAHVVVVVAGAEFAPRVELVGFARCG